MSNAALHQSGVPDLNLRHRLNVTFIYMAVAMSYVVVSAPLFIFYYHKYWMGAVHVLDALIVTFLFVHLRRTKSVDFAVNGLCATAVFTITQIVIDGGIDKSGAYFALPACIFIFFLTNRRRGLLWASAMVVPLFVALILSLTGYITLPYHNLNFALFLFSHLLSLALLFLYAAEKDKLDRMLQQSLNEVRSLAKSLELEKANIEEKVQLRTRQYKEERAKLEASIDSLSIGFIILDRSLSVLSINEAAKHILLSSQPSDEKSATLETMTMSDIVHRLGSGFDLVTQVKACMAQKRPKSARDVAFLSHFLAITITPVVDGDTVIGTVIILEDITDAKALERSRDEFFSIASHELRTPLTAIMGNAAIARDHYKQMDEHDMQEVLDDIGSSGKRLISIVNDFLDMSRLEQGKLQFTIEDVDVLALVQEAIDELHAAHLADRLKLTVQDSTKGALVRADRNRLKQIISNLLSNAIKYTDRGSVTTSLQAVGPNLEIAVTDTGKGIPIESQHLLFRKFQQASNNILTRDTTQSTGLGLYIAKMIAEDMHGMLFLRSSQIDQGSTFVLTLPLAKKKA